jgi:hypothetical protein
LKIQKRVFTNAALKSTQNTYAILAKNASLHLTGVNAVNYVDGINA